MCGKAAPYLLRFNSLGTSANGRQARNSPAVIRKPVVGNRDAPPLSSHERTRKSFVGRAAAQRPKGPSGGG